MYVCVRVCVRASERTNEREYLRCEQICQANTNNNNINNNTTSSSSSSPEKNPLFFIEANRMFCVEFPNGQRNHRRFAVFQVKTGEKNVVHTHAHAHTYNPILSVALRVLLKYFVNRTAAASSLFFLAIDTQID